MKKLLLSLALVLFSFTMFADNGTRVVSNGETSKGNYTVYLSEDVYHFNGKVYEVFDVDYDTLKDIKVAVCGDCYIAYNKDYTIFYNCDKSGFGIRKVLFSNPTSGKNLNAKEFSKQTILVKDDINNKDAIGLIAMFIPNLELNNI